MNVSLASGAVLGRFAEVDNFEQGACPAGGRVRGVSEAEPQLGIDLRAELRYIVVNRLGRPGRH